jgi:malonate transporter
VGVALLLLPDFLLIAGGALLRRLPGFAEAFWPGIERLVYFVLFPALLFRSLATTPLALDDAASLVAVGLAFTIAAMAMSALAQPLFRLPHDTFAACFQCGFRFNTYVVLAVAGSLGGTRGIALASLLVGVLVPTVNLAAVAMFTRGRGGRIASELARNPLVLASLAGIAWNALRLPLPVLPGRVLELLASAAVPLGLLAVGAGLRFERGTLPWPALAWFHFVKLAAMPAIAFVLTRALALPPLETKIAILMAAVPTAPSAYILAMQMNRTGAPVALIISTGTLIAAVTLPLWLALVS